MTAEFIAGKDIAEMHRQVAHSLAQAAFEGMKATIKAQHAARYLAARDAYDVTKADADAPGHDEAKRAFNEAANRPPDFAPAYAQLGRAIWRADTAFHEAVDKLGREHGIGTQTSQPEVRS
jgi:hypothetical protein